MKKFKDYKFFIIITTLALTSQPGNSLIRRQTRNTGGRKAISAPLLGDEINLDTIEGVEQVTKLVLIKTDSLPVESHERIDGRYLNSLMETLYTGLRKPFKSVSADILGIFPSFEEIQVKCDLPTSSRDQLEKDDSINVNIKRKRSINIDPVDFHGRNNVSRNGDNKDESNNSEDRRNETVSTENESSYMAQIPHKSSFQVCQAVTNDCLSMENLVQVLPPTVTTFDKALVRLCPIMLFRIMNNLCQKSSSSIYSRQPDEFISTYQSDRVREEVDRNGQISQKDSISLNTLLRETQILKNLQNSDDLGKRPQKLHKKLKTQTPYKGNGRLNTNGLQPHGSVDEQLLKIRLKLTEPSIEKVWIFSLLFVILSIVVSMGGLIVLPFVKKTTRRKILTLFEGLAVGGLAGSATLHMFPQAFGLVDENYHKYFWRIFVVFFGIYLCYLCERIIKILKVIRAKIKRRSQASLIDMDFCYGFPSVSREFSKNRSRSSRLLEAEYDHSDLMTQSYSPKRKISKNSASIDFGSHETCRKCIESRYLDHGTVNGYSIQCDPELLGRNTRKTKSNKKSKHLHRDTHELDVGPDELPPSTNYGVDFDSISSGVYQSYETRHRLIHCLRSVQKQFSPVYVVQTQNIDCSGQAKDEPRAGRLIRLTTDQTGRSNTKLKKGLTLKSSLKRDKMFENNSIFKRSQSENKNSIKKYMKQRDIETMLYHRGMDGQNGQDESNMTRDYYLQQRLSRVNDVAAERQDQDNAARMSVDTVAWMIVFGDAVLNVIDGLSIGAAFERNILAGISISVAVMLEEVTHRLGTFAVLIRAGMSMQQSLLCTFLSACALFPGLIVGILLSDATEDATPYIFCAAGGIFLYMALVDVMKEMNRSIENAIRKDIKSTLQIFALQNVGIILAVIFLSFLALYEQAMDFEEYQMQYNQPSS